MLSVNTYMYYSRPIIDSAIDDVRYKELINKIDKVLIRTDSINVYVQSKLDSINIKETTIINNHNEKKNAIISGNISDDDVAKFISNEIFNRQQQLLLLYPNRE